MRAYSMDLRDRAFRLLDAGLLPDAVATQLQVSGSWVRLLRQRRRETGEIEPRAQRYGPRRKLEPHLHTWRLLIENSPIARSPSCGMRCPCPSACPRSGAPSMISASALKKTVRPSEHERPDIVRARTAWHQHAPTWNLDQLVFLDETGVTTNLLRRYARAAGRARLRPHAVRPLADQYVSGRVARDRPHRARRVRGRDRRAELPCLSRPDPGAHPAPWATSSSPTTSARTRSAAWRIFSPPPAQRCGISRRTVPISTCLSAQRYVPGASASSATSVVRAPDDHACDACGACNIQGVSVSVCTAGPGRNGVGSPFTQAG